MLAAKSEIRVIGISKYRQEFGSEHTADGITIWGMNDSTLLLTDSETDEILKELTIPLMPMPPKMPKPQS